MSKPQDYSNHTRRDPVFLFILLVLVANIVVQGVIAFRTRGRMEHWELLLAITLFLLAAIVRRYSLRVQDRVIRMEERVRIAAVASPATLARMDEFTIGQFVALRFAPYAELGPLADRTLSENLTPKQIKQAIANWRPDTHRV